jgi:hypothetical protein
MYSVDVSWLISQLITKTTHGAFSNPAAQAYWTGHRDAVVDAFAEAHSVDTPRAYAEVMRLLAAAKPGVI